ncbi:MAG: SDR family oxidoreductase [Christensenellales bacterium]|jgi:short-subunit dehydrogenase
MSNSNQKIAFVTGASSGIGKAIAEIMAKDGYIVYGTSRRAHYESVNFEGVCYTMLPMTLEDEQTISEAVKFVIDKHGRVDVLVNAAGSGIAGAIEETSPAEAKAQFDVCFFGIIGVINHVLPHMRQTGGGTVINIGSMASFFPLPFQGMYCGAKAALFMLTSALRMEAESFGIRVCQIEPGDTKTGFTDKRVLTEKSKNTAYKKLFTRALYEMIRSEQEAKGCEKCARLVLKIARMKRPPIRSVVGAGNKMLYMLTKFVPWWVMKIVVCRLMYMRKDPPKDGTWVPMLKKSMTWKD